MKINKEEISTILTEGLAQKILQREQEGKSKKGYLRAGNSGILVSTPTKDRVYGSCHRKALLRKLDIDLPSEAPVHRIFEHGLGSEDAIVSRLRASKVLQDSGISVLCEDEIPIKWELKDGTPVSGRPDAVLMQNDKPIAIFELKNKQTASGVQNVVDSAKPDSAHLCQAAHYSWRLGVEYGDGTPIPAFLVYSWGVLNDNLMREDFWKTSFARSFIELPKWQSKNPGMAKMKIIPGDVVYSLTWDEQGRVVYDSVAQSEPVTTIITIDAIQAFYEATNMMDSEKFLGPKPTSSHVGNGIGASYSPCGFCQLKESCDNYGDDYDRWLDSVKLHVEEGSWHKKFDK